MQAARVGQQALELVIPYISQNRDLLACSRASTHHRSLISLHIRQHLAHLLAQLHSDVIRGKKQLHGAAAISELKWLCSHSSSSRSTAAGEQHGGMDEQLLQQALLLLETAQDDEDVQEMVEALTPTGLRLTPALALTMARQHHQHMSAVIRHLFCKDKAALLAGADPTHQEDSVILSSAICIMTAVAAWPERLSGLPQLEIILRAAPREVLDAHTPDLLRVACNCESAVAAALLWEAQKHVLLGDGAGEHRLSDSDLRALVLELLESCAVRRHCRLAWHLAESPAAQEVGPQAVLRLVQLDIMHAPCKEDLVGSEADEHRQNPVCLRLPIAQNLPPEAVAQAMHLCVDLGRPYLCQWLLECPSVGDIALDQLCRLILSAMQANELDLAEKIARLMSDRQLPGPDAVALIVDCLKLGLTGWGKDGDELDWMWRLQDDMDLARHLASPADAMALVQQVAADRSLHLYLPLLDDFLPVRVTDRQGMVAALKTMLQLGAEGSVSFANTLLAPEHQLQASDCFELLECSLEAYGVLPAHAMPLCGWEAQQLSQAQVQQLLQRALAKSAARAVGALVAGAPAARSVQLPLLTELLQLAVSQGSSFTLEALLRLPAAQQLDRPALRQLLHAAAAVGHGWQVLHLLGVLRQHSSSPSTTADLDSSQLEQLLVGMHEGKGYAQPQLLSQLLQHSSAEGMSAAGAAAVALGYMHNSGQVDWGPARFGPEFSTWVAPVKQLQLLPSMRQLQCADTLVQLLETCMVYSGCHELQGWAALPAAQHLTAEHVTGLLVRVLEYEPAAVHKAWHVLSALPGCQQLSEGDVEKLYALCADSGCGGEFTNVRNAELLLQLPAAKRLSVGAIHALFDRFLSSSAPVFGALQPLLQLPAAQQLSVLQVKPWVKQAFTATRHGRDVSSARRRRSVHAALMQLPCLAASAAADSELHLWLCALQARA